MRYDHPASGGVVTDAQIQAALTALGLTYTGQPSCPTPVSIPLSSSPLTKMQGEVVSALTKKPVLNLRQVSCLEIYWKAATNGEPALAVDAVGTRLAAQGVVNPRQATDFVRGSLRSFGRRLRSTLTKVPGMTQGAAALIMRVAQTKGVGVDEVVRLMTVMMGAG